MAVNSFQDLKEHVGHKISVVTYGNAVVGTVNVSCECEDCNVVIIDFDSDSDEENSQSETDAEGKVI